MAETTGPVEVELAKLQEIIPAESAMAGGSVYEPKWDGYRMVIVTSADGPRLWSRNGKDLTDRFPDIEHAAADQVSPGPVIDGEVVIWNEGRLSFDLLQQRLVNRPGRAAELAAMTPGVLRRLRSARGRRSRRASADLVRTARDARRSRRQVDSADAGVALDL